MGLIIKAAFFGIIVVGVIFFMNSGLYTNIVGMVSSDGASSPFYTCTDNDGRNTKPYMTQGIVTVTSKLGTREVYTDNCMNDTTVREFLCDPDNNRQMYWDYSCSDRGMECRFGKCLAGW